MNAFGIYLTVWGRRVWSSGPPVLLCSSYGVSRASFVFCSLLVCVDLDLNLKVGGRKGEREGAVF